MKDFTKITLAALQLQMNASNAVKIILLTVYQRISCNVI